MILNWFILILLPKLKIAKGVKWLSWSVVCKLKLHKNNVVLFLSLPSYPSPFLSLSSTSLSFISFSHHPSLSLPLFVCFWAGRGGREHRVSWVFVLFTGNYTASWQQPENRQECHMTQRFNPAAPPFSLSRFLLIAHIHTQPTYKQNSHDANLQTARTACQPLITANESTSISTPHTICIQNIPLHFCLSHSRLQSVHNKYKGSPWTALWQ